MKKIASAPAESAARTPHSTSRTSVIKRILVPIDFSEAGKPALVYAKLLAQLTGAALHLVHVMERIYGAGEIYSGVEFTYIQLDSNEMREQINRRFSALQTGLFREIKTDFEIRTGATFNEIVEASRTMKADLIVMATHGYTGLKHMVLGSTAERVVRHAECPVLVVPSRSPAKPKRRARKAAR